MRVLPIHARHDPRSFRQTTPARSTAGLQDAGHTSEVVDLHASRFDPVFGVHDVPHRIDDRVPDDVPGHMHVERPLPEDAGMPERASRA